MQIAGSSGSERLFVFQAEDGMRGYKVTGVQTCALPILMAINLRGVWSCMKYELRQMLRLGGGAIVNCSSIAGVIGVAGGAAYHAAKHGVIGLTKTEIGRASCRERV